MAFEYYTAGPGGRRLRCGYTTGTCAALAAAGAARLLLTEKAPRTVSLVTPKGVPVEADVEASGLEGRGAFCAVRKDGGDDVDATHGLLIVARAERQDEAGVTILGGEGVGRITMPGLDQPVGAAAINHVPRQMICREVLAVCRELDYSGGLRVTISVPGGAEAAGRTFNPDLGIRGGISILGTSGIVEPMSLQALADTVDLEIRQAAASGARRAILTPGNYGADFLRERGMDDLGVPVIKCSNFIGEALDSCVCHGICQILLVGHMGKLCKVAGGVMNTHSRYAGCRTEIFCAYAAVCGASTELCRALLDAAASDACIALLDGAGLREAVLSRMMDAIEGHLIRRTGGKCQVGAVAFSNQYGLLGRTAGAGEILRDWGWTMRM